MGGLLPGLWLVGALAQAPAAGIDPEELLAGGKRWLAAHVGDAFALEEPLVGFTPALVALALASAGDRDALHSLQSILEKKAATAVSVPAHALLVQALVIDPPSGPAFGPRAAAVDVLLKNLLQCQDLREWRSRRGMLGRAVPTRDKNRGYGGFGLNLAPKRQREFDGRANVLSTALAALSIRSAERFGIALVPPGKRKDPDERAETWPAIASYVVFNATADGRLPAFSGDADEDAASTALGALALALARTADASAPDKSGLAAHERMTSKLASLLAAAPIGEASGRAGEPPGLGIADLLEAAVRSRLAWACGARDVPYATSELARFRQADGGFDAPLELERFRLPDEVALHYSSTGPRRLLATSLAVLALSEAGQALDVLKDSSFLQHLEPADLGAWPRELAADLVACDGMASLHALVPEILRVPDQFELRFLGDCIAARAGWDLAVRAEGVPTARERGLLRWQRWLYDDAARDPGRQTAAARFAKGVRCLLGDENTAELSALRSLYWELNAGEAADELVRLLRASDAETREVTAGFVTSLGSDLGGFDPIAEPEAMTTEVEAIEAQLRRRIAR